MSSRLRVWPRLLGALLASLVAATVSGAPKAPETSGPLADRSSPGSDRQEPARPSGSPPLTYFDAARPGFARNADRLSQIAFPLTLRIGLEEKQSSVTMTCPKAFTVRHGDRTVAAAAQERWTFRIRQAEPAEVEYSVAVRTVEWAERARADAEALSWRERGYPGAARIEAGALMSTGQTVVHDNRRHYVAVVRTTNREAADQALKALTAGGERPFLVERLVAEPVGIIEASGPAGPAIVGRGPFEIASGDRVRVFQVEHDIGYPWYGREDRDYAGSIVVMVDRWGNIVVINRVELEKYLKGVVPAEIEADAPLEGQKTQAVCARGEALAGYGVRHPADPYDFEASQRDQQYAGLGRETAIATRAVDETRGLVLKRGDIITETVYGANCGGHTEDNDAVWSSPVEPSLRAVPDAEPGAVPTPITEPVLISYLEGSPESYCRDPRDLPTNKYRWKTTRTAEEMDKLVAAAGFDVGRVLELKPLTRGRSGRLKKLEVIGESGRVTVAKELPIRQLLGGLKSALFVVKAVAADARPASWIFTGGGWGHGVGMCQMGARGMSRAGKDFRQILTHYFSATAIRKLY